MSTSIVMSTHQHHNTSTSMSNAGALDIETEVHDVTVLHYIILALDRELASLAHSSLRAVLHVIVVLDDLGTDEALRSRYG